VVGPQQTDSLRAVAGNDRRVRVTEAIPVSGLCDGPPERALRASACWTRIGCRGVRAARLRRRPSRNDAALHGRNIAGQQPVGRATPQQRSSSRSCLAARVSSAPDGARRRRARCRPYHTRLATLDRARPRAPRPRAAS
jgi:hypothetical protein